MKAVLCNFNFKWLQFPSYTRTILVFMKQKKYVLLTCKGLEHVKLLFTPRKFQFCGATFQN